MSEKHTQWRSQDFSTGGGGGRGQSAKGKEGREIFENSCIKMAFFFFWHIKCNCKVGLYRASYVYWLRPIPYPFYSPINRGGGGGGVVPLCPHHFNALCGHVCVTSHVEREPTGLCNSTSLLYCISRQNLSHLYLL